MTRSAAHPARADVLGGHISAGILSGTFFGFVYFLLEAIVGSWGDVGQLGEPLARIMGTYLLFGVVVGALVGILVGAAAALMRGRVSADSYVPYYFSSFAFLAVFMYTGGKHSTSYLKSLVTSVGIVWQLLILIGLTAVGYVLARVLRRRAVLRRVGRRAALSMVLACLVLAGLAHWVGGFSKGRLPPPGADEGSGGPNVVFILLDAFRADHVSASGYHRDTTPNIDGLARDGVLFRRAYSHGNRTIISVPSIFTSLYPSVHGAGGHGRLATPLAEEWTTIAELFRDKGYATIGLVPNVYFDPQFNLTQGFDKIERFYYGRYDLGLYRVLRRAHVMEVSRSRYRPWASDVMDTALQWLDRVNERPYFMYIHFMDTHHPYDPPPPYDTLWGDETDAIDPMELFTKTTRLLRESAASTLSETELAKLTDYYDGAIRFTDDQIGRLIEKAKADGARETIVIVTADHGDEFLEHGLFYHNNLVIEELIHIPLVIWSSKRFSRGLEVQGLVRHIDLLPTIADLIGVAVPPQAWGRSLVPVLEGETDSLDLKSIAEGDYCTSLNYQNWKILRIDSTDSYQFYDLTRTPREKEDVCGVFPDECAVLRAQLEAYFQQAAVAKKRRAVGLDERTIRELKALGYL